MKTEKEIREALKRFMDGQTSVEEEEAIARYFRANDVSGDLKPYKAMFAWFDEGMPLPQPKPARRRYWLRVATTLATSAAAIALLIIIHMNYNATDTASICPPPSHRDPVIPTTETTDTTRRDSARSDEPRREMRRGTPRKYLYSPAPPKYDLAKAQDDSLMREANMLAEKRLDEIYRKQNLEMMMIERAFDRQQCDVELIMAALDDDVVYE